MPSQVVSISKQEPVFFLFLIFYTYIYLFLDKSKIFYKKQQGKMGRQNIINIKIKIESTHHRDRPKKDVEKLAIKS